MTNRYGVGTGASCAWSEKPADIARLEFRNLCKHDCCAVRLVGVLGAEPLGEGVVKDMALEIADGQSECF